MSLKFETDNEKYISKDDVIFTKDMTELVRYPGDKADRDYHIPEGVELVRSGAFPDNPFLEAVYFPESVGEIEDGAFGDCPEIDFPEVFLIRETEDEYLIEMILPEDREEKFFCRFDGKKIHRASFDEEEFLQYPEVEDRAQRRALIDKLMENVRWDNRLSDQETEYLHDAIRDFGKRLFNVEEHEGEWKL